jgi:site-specific recombinase XerD
MILAVASLKKMMKKTQMMMKKTPKRYPPEPLSRDETRNLLDACGTSSTGIRNRALITTLWRAGLRIAEALALETRDLDAGVLRVRRGKGGKQRVVALDPAAFASVQAWLDRKAQLGIGGPIFSTLKGGQMQSSYVRNAFKRLRRKAGITKRVHAHGLRHTFASELADEKTDVRVIQRALGHSSLQTTQGYIDHLRPTAVIDVLKARVWG